MLALLLAACGCPDFDQVRVWDESGAASTEELADLEDRLAWFQQVTGLDGVCVDEVVVEGQVERGGLPYAGYYNGFAHRIRLTHAAGMDQVLVHELCHGAHSVLGHPSQGRDDIFDPDSVDAEYYRGRRERIEEAFANQCERGPQDLRLAVALGDHCGDSLDDAVAIWMLETIYTEVELPPLSLSFADLSTADDGPLSPALADAVVLRLAATERSIAAVVARWPAGAGRGGPLWPLAVVHIDPASRGLLSQTRLPALDVSRLALLDGQDAAWLVAQSAQGEAWFHEIPVEGGRRAVARMNQEVVAAGGVVLGSSAWLYGGLGADGDGRHVAVVDLATGTVDPDPLVGLELDPAVGLSPVAGVASPQVLARGLDGRPRLVDLSQRTASVSPVSWADVVALREDGGTFVAGAGLLGRVEADGLDATVEHACGGDEVYDRTLLRVGDSAWLAAWRGERAGDISLRLLR